MSVDIDLIYGRSRIAGYVYCIMDNKNGICKIGMSAGEKERVAGLRASYPHKTDFKIMAVQDRCEAEKYMHKRFHNRRVHGEWFKDVSFEEYETALKEYILKKSVFRFDSISFYKFLYDTEYHAIKGMSAAEERTLKLKEVGIFIYTHKYFNDKHLFRTKMDFSLKELKSSSEIELICPDWCNNKHANDYYYYSKNNMNIGIREFFSRFDNKLLSNDGSYLDNCLRAIDQCYAAIFFMKNETTYTTNKIIEYAKSTGVKVKVINSDISTNLDGTRSKVVYKKTKKKVYFTPAKYIQTSFKQYSVKGFKSI